MIIICINGVYENSLYNLTTDRLTFSVKADKYSKQRSTKSRHLFLGVAKNMHMRIRCIYGCTNHKQHFNVFLLHLALCCLLETQFVSEGVELLAIQVQKVLI